MLQRCVGNGLGRGAASAKVLPTESFMYLLIHVSMLHQ
jgi:hypothetical protein